MDSVLFNEIIFRADLCTPNQSLQMKIYIEEIDSRFRDSTFIGSHENWLLNTKQLISCLSIDKKLLCDPDVRHKVCPNLNLVQLKQLCSIYVVEGEERSIVSKGYSTKSNEGFII